MEVREREPGIVERDLDSEGTFMTNAGTPQTPAGWYPDPAGSPRSRWWDGTQWTDHFQEPYSTTTTADLKAPEGAPVYTPWIWIIVFLPYLAILPLFFINWSHMFHFDFDDPSSAVAGQFAILTNPLYLIASFGGWIAYGLGVWFGYLDWKTLTTGGVPRPFHWAWNFIPTIVYPIGRSVVVKRRTGKGIAPMWVAIVLMIVSFIATIVLVGVIMSAALSQIPDFPTSP